MKYILLGLGALLVGAYMIYSSNVFQSYIYPQQFYADIYRAPFDVTQKDAAINIPITYKYKTRYALYISVDDINAMYDLRKEEGILSYKFISQGKVLKEGLTIAPTMENVTYTNTSSSVAILKFELPLKEDERDLILVLKVIKPLFFLNKYSGKITCEISPWEEYK